VGKDNNLLNGSDIVSFGILAGPARCENRSYDSARTQNVVVAGEANSSPTNVTILIGRCTTTSGPGKMLTARIAVILHIYYNFNRVGDDEYGMLLVSPPHCDSQNQDLVVVAQVLRLNVVENTSR
jgi:hypothetical protein